MSISLSPHRSPATSRRMARMLLLIAASGVGLVSCGGDVRYGIERTEVATAASDASVLSALQHALEPSQAGCAVRLVQRGSPPSDGSNNSREVVSAEVCGKRQTYEVRWIRVSEGQVMVTAKRS